MKEINKWRVEEYEFLTLNMLAPKSPKYSGLDLADARKKSESQKKPQIPQFNLVDYITAKHAMYDVLERFLQVNPAQIGVANFLIEQEYEKMGADIYESEDIRNGLGFDSDRQLAASDFGTAITVFESLPKQEISEPDFGLIKKALESRKAVLSAPIKVKPAPEIGSVRKVEPLFKRRTKSTGPKA